MIRGRKKVRWAHPLGPNAKPRDEFSIRHAAEPHVGVHVMRLDDGYFYACDARQKESGGEIPAKGPFRTMAAAERAAQRYYGG